MCDGARIARVRAITGASATLAIALASLLALAAPAAADWQAPVILSPLGAEVVAPTLAVNAAGDSAALWWDNQDGGRLALIRRPAGGGWSATVTVAAPVPTPTVGRIGIDGAGTVTVAYTLGGSTEVVTWPASAATPSRTALPTVVTYLYSLQINAAGAAVLVGESDTSPPVITVAYRRAADTDFELRTYSVPGLAPTYPVAAINGAGTAIVVFTSAGVQALVRSPFADWPAMPETVDSTPDVYGDNRVALDDAGNAQVVYTHYTSAPARIVRVVGRPASSGVWGQPADLSLGGADSFASPPSLSVAATGNTVLAWQQYVGETSTSHLVFGRSDRGTFQPEDELVKTNTWATAFVAGADGGVAATWIERTPPGSVVQLGVRTAGVWSPVRTVTVPHGDENQVAISSIATDGKGSYLAAGAIDGAPGHNHALALWVYDAVAPVVSAPSVSGTLTARSPLTFSVTATDVWSPFGAPEWSFGDGTSGAGLRVTHAYAEPGTYRASVSVTDGAGNAATREISVVVTKAQAELTAASFAVRWQRSRAAGALRVAGRVPLEGTYVVELTRGSVRVLRASVQLAAGEFARKLKLPARLVPGSYGIRLLPQALPVSLPTRTAKLTAPGEGVVDTAFLSGSRTGAAARRLSGSRNVWATFHFAARASSSLRLTWYITTAGVRKQVRTVVRAPSARVRDAFAPHGMHGTVTAVLQRAGRVVAQVSATLR
jgi:PKD repeat protein